eukprot:2364152-Amphidinium_carterae.2
MPTWAASPMDFISTHLLLLTYELPAIKALRELERRHGLGYLLLDMSGWTKMLENDWILRTHQRDPVRHDFALATVRPLRLPPASTTAPLRARYKGYKFLL